MTNWTRWRELTRANVNLMPGVTPRASSRVFDPCLFRSRGHAPSTAAPYFSSTLLATRSPERLLVLLAADRAVAPVTGLLAPDAFVAGRPGNCDAGRLRRRSSLGIAESPLLASVKPFPLSVPQVSNRFVGGRSLFAVGALL